MGRAQPRDERFQLLLRRVVEPQAIGGLGLGRHLDVRHDDRAAEGVVENDERIRDHQHGIGHAERVGGRMGEPLDAAHDVVADVAHRAAREPRQPGNRHGGEGPHAVGEVGDRILRRAGRLPARCGRPAVDPGSAIAEDLARLGTEEGVAGPALAADQRFEQERERRPGDLGERRHRRIGVGHDFAGHRHDAAGLRALQKCVSGVAHLDFAAMHRSVLLLPLLLAAPLSIGSGQEWNGDSALALARRATARRERAAGDTALRDYKAQAHGFVFFLGQFGEGLTQPPRLVKADQLELEVYWKAPQLSKQRIIGWRDRAELPTDINYHRDHLGIVQNNFGTAIRLGEGDEVRDVPHPLGPDGPAVYDFALGDTTTIVLPQRAVRVAALRVRPKQFSGAAIVGTLFLDLESADLVRMAFNFTARAYLDPQLEDVSVVLDNALWEGRFWLPYRQEIEIRRRATWLDIPARGIIRGRWEIDGYLFNVGLA